MLKLSRHGSPPSHLCVVNVGPCVAIAASQMFEVTPSGNKRQGGVSVSQKVPSPDDGSVDGADNIGVDDNVPADSESTT